MNLNKNDKIILIAGILILIIAAVGVAVYTSPDTDDITAGDTKPEYKNYSYNWKANSGEKTIEESMYVDKNSEYSDSFTITTPSGSILTNVDVIVNWEDDNTYGLLRRKGEDVLTIEINQRGSAPKTESSEGGGYMNFTFKVNDLPTSDLVFAEDKQDAKEIIEGMFPDENFASFDITASIDTGERLLRFLQFIRDQGNDFELKLKYTYYSCLIEEPHDEDEEDKNTGSDSLYTSALGEFYKNLCYGRGMI
jgi:hypothetical protein